MRAPAVRHPRSPVLKNESIAAYGWDSSARPESCGYVAPIVLDIVHGLGARRILDLGCGNGELCGLLARAGCEVVGVELDTAGVQLARRTHPGVRFHNFGVQDDPRDLLAHERGHRFEAVVSTEVIEHLFAPHLLVAYARAVLVPGGSLVVSTPYHGYLKNLALSLAGHWDRHHTPLWHGGHIKFWSRATLTQLLTEHGFRVTGFRGAGRAPWLWKSMILTGRAQ